MKFLLPADESRWHRLQDLNTPVFDSIETELLQILHSSPFAFDQVLRYPTLLDLFLLREIIDPITLVNAQLEKLADLDFKAAQAALRHSRNQALACIVWNEVVQQQSCEDTLQQCSELADCLIRTASTQAEAQWQKRYGTPLDESGQALQPLILALGKLGGSELNFSSDVDLILLYPDDGEFSTGFTYQEYYLKWARSLNQLLGETTADGFVYRVDLRLRPWGQSGPLAMSLTGLEQYLSLHARQWERYAWVKARVLAGATRDAQWLVELQRPFVYRRYHDHAVFAGLRELKEKINREVKLKDVENHVKLGRGGIREIEFVVQALQILRGGRNHALQDSRILNIMALNDEDLQLRDQNIAELREPYLQLRRIENALQMMQDQQVYTLPADTIAQQRLCTALGYAHWNDLRVELVRIQHHVRRLFDALFSAPKEEHPEKGLLPFEVTAASRTEWLEYLQDREQSSPEALADVLHRFSTSHSLHTLSAQGQARLAWLMPVLLEKILPLENPPELLQRILGLLLAVSGRSIYMELLKQQPLLLERLLQILSRSAWVAEELTRFPFLLEEILRNYRLDNAMAPGVLAHELQHLLQNAGDDRELQLDQLRQFKRSRSIWIAAAELAGDIEASEASDYLSRLAEALLQAATQLALEDMIQRHGRPRYQDNGEWFEAQLAIIAYGKLGSRELQYSSDLDLIFIHDSGSEKACSDGLHELQNPVYFARLAQKIISIITLMTSAGKLYEIDVRLRPDGASGMLVSHIDSFTQYQREKAWSWEHQALCRARFVFGPNALQNRFTELRSEILCRPRERQSLSQAIVSMREKLRTHQPPVEDRGFDLKHGVGGLIDIEFISQFLLLLYSHKHPALQQYSATIPALHALAQAGIETECCTRLAEIYPRLRNCMHLAALQQAATTVERPVVEGDSQLVRECWQQILPSS